MPAVTVPWAGAAEGHQERNARCFASLGGGAVWHEGDGVPLSGVIETQLERGGAQKRRTATDASAAIAHAAGLCPAAEGVSAGFF